MYTIIFEKGNRSAVLPPERIPDDAELSLEIGRKEKLTLTLYPQFEAWDMPEKYVTYVRVLDTSTPAQEFFGRVSDIEDTLDEAGKRCRKLTCGGIIDVLEDTLVKISFDQYENAYDFKTIIEDILSTHNGKVTDSRNEFYIGDISAIGNARAGITKYFFEMQTSYQALLYLCGGHKQDERDEEARVRFETDAPPVVMSVRRENEKNYLDFLPQSQIGKKSGVSIKIGNNLRTLTALYSGEDKIASRVYAISKPDAYANHAFIDEADENTSGKLYIEDPELVALVGVREKTIVGEKYTTSSWNWDKIHSPEWYKRVSNYLYELAVEELKRQKEKPVQLTLSAVDLKKMGYENYDEFKLGNTHDLICPQLNIFREVRITALKRKLAHPKDVNITISSGEPITANTLSGNINALSKAVSAVSSESANYYRTVVEDAVGKKGTATGAEYFNSYDGIAANKANGMYSHAQGYITEANGFCSHTEGSLTKTGVYADCAHAEGSSTEANGRDSHAEGERTVANGNQSHAEGARTEASGAYSHAEGLLTEATGLTSHAEGGETIASGWVSHAEGYKTIASGRYAHAKGSETTASGKLAYAEGYHTAATSTLGNNDSSTNAGHYVTSHAQGAFTIASGRVSHAQGLRTTASGLISAAGGINTIAAGTGQTVIGQSNANDPDNLFEIGNGEIPELETNEISADDFVAKFDNVKRSNIFEVSRTAVKVNGEFYVNGAQIDMSQTSQLLTQISELTTLAETLAGQVETLTEQVETLKTKTETLSGQAGGISFKQLTRAEYTAAEKSESTVYFVTERNGDIIVYMGETRCGVSGITSDIVTRATMTKAMYEKQTRKSSTTIYVIDDTGEVYLGDILLNSGTAAETARSVSLAVSRVNSFTAQVTEGE